MVHRPTKPPSAVAFPGMPDGQSPLVKVAVNRAFQGPVFCFWMNAYLDPGSCENKCHLSVAGKQSQPLPCKSSQRQASLLVWLTF